MRIPVCACVQVWDWKRAANIKLCPTALRRLGLNGNAAERDLNRYPGHWEAGSALPLAISSPAARVCAPVATHAAPARLQTSCTSRAPLATPPRSRRWVPCSSRARFPALPAPWPTTPRAACPTLGAPSSPTSAATSSASSVLVLVRACLLHDNESRCLNASEAGANRGWPCRFLGRSLAAKVLRAGARPEDFVMVTGVGDERLLKVLDASWARPAGEVNGDLCYVGVHPALCGAACLSCCFAAPVRVIALYIICGPPLAEASAARAIFPP